MVKVIPSAWHRNGNGDGGDERDLPWQIASACASICSPAAYSLLLTFDWSLNIQTHTLQFGHLRNQSLNLSLRLLVLALNLLIIPQKPFKPSIIVSIG